MTYVEQEALLEITRLREDLEAATVIARAAVDYVDALGVWIGAVGKISEQKDLEKIVSLMLQTRISLQKAVREYGNFARKVGKAEFSRTGPTLPQG